MRARRTRKRLLLVVFLLPSVGHRCLRPVHSPLPGSTVGPSSVSAAYAATAPAFSSLFIISSYQALSLKA